MISYINEVLNTIKKIIIGLYIMTIVFPIFAQEKDSRTPFQGIWYGVIYDEYKVVFTFIDDIFISNLDLGYSGSFSVEDQNLIMNTKYDCLNSGDIREIHGESAILKIQYIFSGNKLLLIFDGEPITLSRNYEDFSEWR